jgi:hypothetical protein
MSVTITKCFEETPTMSALGPSSEGFSRHFPVQYIDSGEPQRLMGDIVSPYQDSFSILSVIMESDFFDLVRIGDILARSKVPGEDETGDERT